MLENAAPTTPPSPTNSNTINTMPATFSINSNMSANTGQSMSTTPNSTVPPIQSSTAGTSNMPPVNMDNIAPPKKSGPAKTLLVILMVILFLLIGASTTLVLAAYEKIILPNAMIQEAIAYNVISLPFMPKTPKYVLTQAAVNHASLSSARIDSKFNASSNEISEFYGKDNIEFNVTGPVDYNNFQDPKFAFNVNVPSEFDFDIKILNKTIFFKLNKLPKMFYDNLRINQPKFDSIALSKWVSYDISDVFDSQEEQTEASAPSSYPEEVIIKILNSRVVPKLIMSEEQLDGNNVYKIELPLTQTELKELQSEFAKLSTDTAPEIQNALTTSDISFIENFKITMWVDKSAMHVNQAQIAFNVYSSSYDNTLKVLGISTIADESEVKSAAFDWVIKLSDHGKDFTADIVAPENSVDLETFIDNLTYIYYEGMMGGSGEDYEGFGEIQN